MGITQVKKTVYITSDGTPFLDKGMATRHDCVASMTDILDDLHVSWDMVTPERLAQCLFEDGYEIVKRVEEPDYVES